MTDNDRSEQRDGFEFLVALAIKRWEAHDRLFSEHASRMTALVGVAAAAAGAGAGAVAALRPLGLFNGLVTAAGGLSLAWLATECFRSMRTQAFRALPNPLGLYDRYDTDPILVRAWALDELGAAADVNRKTLARKAAALDRALIALAALLVAVGILSVQALSQGDSMANQNDKQAPTLPTKPADPRPVREEDKRSYTPKPQPQANPKPR